MSTHVKKAGTVPVIPDISTHPDFSYWYPIWEKIRDAEIGEIQVKARGEKYLPRQGTHDQKQYASYLERAVFYNMTARTLSALYGTVFGRLPKVTGMPKKLLSNMQKVTKDGLSLHLMAKTAVKEVLAVGRYGMLVDADPTGRGSPYIACYVAENILDWEMAEINGVWQLSKVLLREIYYDRSENIAASLKPYSTVTRYRLLILEEDIDGKYFYTQYLYKPSEDNSAVIVTDTIIPTVRGEPIDYIPFVVVGPFTNHPDIQKPPLLDIALMNYAHYKSYAQLEQALFYTGSPIYTVQQEPGSVEPGLDDNGYRVGPDTVWIMGPKEEAKVLEFNGRGLQHLENSLHTKEAQIASIGGRLMPGTSHGTAESDNSLLMKERNEQTLLLNLCDTIDEALTRVLRWYADWSNVPASTAAKIEFKVNRDFITRAVGAREYRAIHQMYADGVIPLEVVYDFLRRFEVIPEWMSKEEYAQLLQDADQFPNMVDVLARMQEFPDAKTFYEYKMEQMRARDVEPSPTDPPEPISSGRPV